jgi:hypothetical protein
MPEVEPVMMATFPSSLPMILFPPVRNIHSLAAPDFDTTPQFSNLSVIYDIGIREEKQSAKSRFFPREKERL